MDRRRERTREGKGKIGEGSVGPGGKEKKVNKQKTGKYKSKIEFVIAFPFLHDKDHQSVFQVFFGYPSAFWFGDEIEEGKEVKEEKAIHD